MTGLCVSADSISNFGPGLVATATDGVRSVVWITRTPNFTLTPTQSIRPELKPEFTADWAGVLKIVRTGSYTLFSDAVLRLDGKETQNQPVPLSAGEHEVRISYSRPAGKTAQLQLQWESDHFKREPVPEGVLGHRAVPPAAALTVEADRGRDLVETLGCVSCHKSSNRLLKSRAAKGFASIGQLNADWLMSSNAMERHLDGRANFRLLPAGDQIEMRNVIDAIATFAVGPANVSASDKSKEPRGSAEKGRELYQSVGCLGCHGEKGLPLAGVSKKWPRRVLTAYLTNPLAFNPVGRMPDMSLSPAEAANLSEFLLSSASPGGGSKAAPINSNPESGRRALEASGCVNCHAGAIDGKMLVNRLVAAPLEKIRIDRVCANKMGPRYAISGEDWSAIRAFLKSPDVSEAPVQEFDRLVKQFNCNGCHELNGPSSLSFEVNQGPPPLSDAGNKLRASWLHQVLLEKKRVRPWMALRMPHFGESVRPLVTDFASQAGAGVGEGEIAAPLNGAQLQAGIKLLGRGEGGLSCISCHDFKGEKPPGDIRGPDMTEMSARIRADWMRRWLRDPGRIQPGTAMPSFFGEFATAQGEQTISSIVRILASGKALPMPEGMSDAAQQYLLLVKNEPVVFRTFIQDSSPRSIAVGLPGAQNYVFDAENCRFRYAWRGDFLDVKPVWSDRGGGKAKILGTRYYTAPDWQPVRIGNPETEPRVAFRGYRLVNGLPEFQFELDHVLVRETVRCTARGDGLIQEFAIDSPGRDVWFVTSEFPQVAITCSAGPLEKGRIKVSSGGSSTFEVTVAAAPKQSQ